MAGKYARATTILMLAAALAAGASPCSGTAAPFEYMPLVRIPRYYNLMEEGKRPAVRSQGDLETCWAISACSAIESDLLPEERICSLRITCRCRMDISPGRRTAAITI